MDQERLVGIHKNHAGEIISFQTASGRIISYRKALQEAAEGRILGVSIHDEADGSASILSSEGLSWEHFPEVY